MEDFHSRDKKDDILLETAVNYAMPAAEDVDVAWHKMQRRIENSSSIIPISPRKYRILRTVAAAAVFLLFITTISILFNQQEFISKPGQIAEITLPDNSIIWVNSVSTISYNSILWHFNRKVKFDGEAFFKVVKGSSFVVETNFGNVEVLGTAFNVNTFDNSLNVYCRSGKVLISNDVKGVELAAGEYCIVTKENIRAYPVENPDQYISWMDGEFTFNERPINEVLSVLERQYDIDISSNFKGDELFTGTFDNKNLTSALELICTPYGKTFVIKEHRIVEIK